jgi:predicted ATPase
VLPTLPMEHQVLIGEKDDTAGCTRQILDSRISLAAIRFERQAGLHAPDVRGHSGFLIRE